MKIMHQIIALSVMAILVSACGNSSVNDNVRITKGEKHEGGARSVNGNIVIGSDAVLQGDISTVNGDVDIDEGAEVGNVKTVNGSIRLAERVSAGNLDSVNGGVRMLPGSMTSGIRLVNGSLEAGEGTRISGDATLVNGTIELFGATVEGNLEIYSGNMLVTDTSKVSGRIIVKKPKASFGSDEKPRIVIGPGSVVAGGVLAEREIKLFVHESAQIGAIEGADAQTFSGSVSDID